MTRAVEALIFDFDGTLVDSDATLTAAFLALGVDPDEVGFGHAIAAACEHLGLRVDEYADVYDEEAASPFAGVADVVPSLGRWALCSNKHPRSGRAELRRLGWEPELAVFADHFDWAHKSLGPVLALMELAPDQVVMVGDSEGDVRCADGVGCRFAWAGWNPRVAAVRPDGLVLDRPDQLLDLYG
ncbi:MAG: HAD family hydrolase [Microthrixaceae bacterium]